MLYKYGLYTSNEDLNADINSYFSEQKWIKSDLFEEDLDEEFSREWDSFSEIVKHQRRYTFSYSPKFIPKERWRSDILSRIRHLCESMLVTSLEVDTYLYRGRPNENEHSCFSLFEELASPPPAYAKSNRMSAEGISLFYGALDKETVLQEIRNYCSPKSIDIGTFKTSQDLFVVDLFNVPEHLSFWMPQYYEGYKFLRKFHHEITQPLAKPSDAAYAPTQIFTEHLRYLSNRQIDGIIYRSAITGKKNVVLFYDNTNSSTILNLERTEKCLLEN